MQMGFVLSLIFATLVAIFAIQNSAVIYVKFFFTSFQVSQALIIFISAVLGAVIVMFLGLRREYALRKKLKQTEKNLSQKDEEITSLTTEINNLKEQLNFPHNKKQTDDIEAKKNQTI